MGGAGVCLNCGEVIECPECAEDRRSECNGLLSAVKVFEKIKEDYDEWYMKRDKVSLMMICDRDACVKKCDWAIDVLRKAIKGA